MNTVHRSYSSSLTDKKSKFYSYIYNISSEEELKKELKAIKNKYSDARHWCYGTRFYQNGNLIEKSSDNSEPNGTAGKPILNVLKSNDLMDVVLIVVRYFGGIKLGIPGLINAYKTSAQDVVEKAKILPYQKYEKYNEAVSLSDYDHWKREIEKKGGIILSSKFGIVIKVDYKLPI